MLSLFQLALTSQNDAVVTTNVVNPESFSFFNSFLQADFIVQFVMIILILGSVWSWAIVFEKFISFKTLNYKMNRFEEEFWSGSSLEKLFQQIKGRQDHPLALIFNAAFNEWDDKNVKSINGDSSLRANTQMRIYKAMEVASNKALEAVEKNISFLATVASSAPFIGLFGTVWGIMTSFQSIAASKNTTLAVVAPGIAEALLATAIGLATAIPAAIFYNKFSAQINKLSNKFETFSIELGSIISRELDKH